MRVLVCPLEQDASCYYRLAWPATALKAQGADVAVGKLPAGIWRDTPGQLPKLESLTEAPPADVVVIQRPIYHWLPDAVRLLQAKGVAVVVDLDDAFWCIQPGNIAGRALNPKRRPDRNWQHVDQTAALADLVTTTTPGLAARYGRHGRVKVLPNAVPASYLEIPRFPSDEPATVTWSGSIDTHPDDLQTTRGQVGRVLRETGARMRVVGTGKGVQSALGLPDPPEVAGWVPLTEYPAAMAQAHVGVVPLADNLFNRAGKSWLKMAELSAVGVAAVASPTEDNRRLYRHGAGLLAHKPADWYRQTRRLVEDRAWRDEVAGRSREAMRAWTIEARAGDWLEAWEIAGIFRRTAVLLSTQDVRQQHEENP